MLSEFIPYFPTFYLSTIYISGAILFLHNKKFEMVIGKWVTYKRFFLSPSMAGNLFGVFMMLFNWPYYLIWRVITHQSAKEKLEEMVNKL